MGKKFRFWLHRHYNGTVKTVTVKRTPHGDYYIVLSVVEEIFLPDVHAGNAVGIDFGLKTFLTLSDGTKIESPQWLLSVVVARFGECAQSESSTVPESKRVRKPETGSPSLRESTRGYFESTARLVLQAGAFAYNCIHCHLFGRFKPRCDETAVGTQGFRFGLFGVCAYSGV